MTDDTKYISEEEQSNNLPRHRKKRWEVTKLNDKYRAIAKMLAAGLSQIKIAEEVGIAILNERLRQLLKKVRIV